MLSIPQEKAEEEGENQISHQSTGSFVDAPTHEGIQSNSDVLENASNNGQPTTTNSIATFEEKR